MQSAMIILAMAAAIHAANATRGQNVDEGTAMGQRQFGLDSADFAAHRDTNAFHSLDSSLKGKDKEPCKQEVSFKLGAHSLFETSHKKIMAEFLARCGSILTSVRVDMSEKKQADKYIKESAEAKVNLPKLTSLHLIGRSYRANGPNDFRGMTKVGAEALVKILDQANALVELRMVQTLLDTDGGQRLAQAQETFKRLRVLDMSSNPDGARSLFHTIKEWPSLEHLLLNFNTLGQEGAQELAAALQGSHDLKKLELTFDRIQVAGAEHIAGALSQKMEVLNLDWNNITGIGAEAFAKSLNGSRAHLREVSLRNNHIDDSGVSALVEALKDAPNLWKLDLSDNKIAGTGARALADAFVHLPKLTHFNIMYNDIDDDSRKYMVDTWYNIKGSPYTDGFKRRDDMSFEWDPQNTDLDDLLA